MSTSQAREVKRRDDKFADKAQTKIWHEVACRDNPYIAETVYCHGYERFDLLENCTFIEVLFLLFRGELPKPEEKQLLEKLLIGFINLGPRHAATRAAMNTGVGKTHAVHILPIASIVLGGDRACAGEIEKIMRFFRKNFRKPAEEVAQDLIFSVDELNWEDIPGFGQVYGGIDIQSEKFANYILNNTTTGDIFSWGQTFSAIIKDKSAGWHDVGIAAAIFSDLGFHPKLGGSLFQLMCAPGLIAHGFEYVTKPLTAMPYVKDEDYVIKD